MTAQAVIEIPSGTHLGSALPVWSLAILLGVFSLPIDAAIPTQYIAKLHTEMLGRLPEPEEWNSAVSYYRQAGCNRESLKAHGIRILASVEMASHGYDNDSLTLLMYRGILNSEPLRSDYDAYVKRLNSGVSLTEIATRFYTEERFAELLPLICSGGTYGFSAFGDPPTLRPALLPGSPKSHGNISGDALQQILNESAGKTVLLRKHTVIYLERTLVIPPGVTLATDGLPDNTRHGEMARLVRAHGFNAPLVLIRSPASDTHGIFAQKSGALTNLWVDGGRTNDSLFVPQAVNIQVEGGNGALVADNFIANTLGWTSVHALSTLEGKKCADLRIVDNLITVYPSGHYDKTWADGLSIGCENALVAGNQIVDATDVGIVLFTSYPATQRSQVLGNKVLSAGNSAFAAYGVDPLYSYTGKPDERPDFSGSKVSNNILWSGEHTHFVMGLAIGTAAWTFVRDGHEAPNNIGTGATVTNNTTNGIGTNLNAGIVISGMLNATVQGNVLLRRPRLISQCPAGNVLAAVSAGLAGGTLQDYRDVASYHCISDFSKPNEGGLEGP